MYAIVKTGGKQYRVEEGQTLLVERLPVSDGESVDLQPLLFVDGTSVVDMPDELSSVTVAARVVAHERGPKLRIVKFKPKRGYKRRNGHRQELTRIEVTEIKAGGSSKSGSRQAPAKDESPTPPPDAATQEAPAPETPAAAEAAAAAALTPAATAEAPATAVVEAPETAEDAPVTPATTTPEDSDGS